jgi:hypothetical protein
MPEVSQTSYQATWRHIPEDSTLHSHHCENFNANAYTLLERKTKRKRPPERSRRRWEDNTLYWHDCFLQSPFQFISRPTISCYIVYGEADKSLAL